MGNPLTITNYFGKECRGCLLDEIKMKKFFALLMTVILVFSLAACSAPESEESSEAVESEESSGAALNGDEPVTIKFANYAILESGYEEFWEGVKTGFEEKYDNITIEWVTAPYGEILNQVINMAGAGDKVDLMLGEVAWTATLQDAGLAVPIDTVLNDEFLNDFYPNALEACSIEGKSYALPIYISPWVLYYNKDLFEQAGLDPESPPKTYDEMLEMAEKFSNLKTPDGNKIYAFGQTTASVPVSGASLNAMVHNFGGELLDSEGNLNVDTPEVKEAFEMLKLLDEKGYNPQNAKLKDLRNLFALGQLAMYYDQSWGFNGVQSINSEANNFTASAPPLAGGDGTGESIIEAHTLTFMDNGANQKEAVRLLVEYLITPEVLSDYLTTITPAYPARKSMANITADNQILKGAANSIEKALPTPLIPRLNDLYLELTTFAQAITVGGKSVDEGIAEFKEAANALLD